MSATRPLHAWTSRAFPVPLPETHPFPIAKGGLVTARAMTEGILDAREIHDSRPAPFEWIERVHEPSYVARALTGALDAAEIRRLGMPWSHELVARARAGVWGTVCAARAARVHGVAGNLAGGSHHARRDRAEAYCLFNDLAVAVATLRAEGAARRPFVADLDVHQGDGTAAIFAADSTVFTFSMHGERNHPARKERGSLDVALPDDCGDDAYLAALDRHLPAALERHRPDLVLYQAGVDTLAEDRLGRLALTRAGLAARDVFVFERCERVGVPVVVTLGGGYARPIEASIEAHLDVWRAARAARDRRPPVDDVVRFDHQGDDGTESR